MSVKVQHENDLSWMQSSRFNYASEPVDCFCWDGYEPQPSEEVETIRRHAEAITVDSSDTGDFDTSNQLTLEERVG